MCESAKAKIFIADTGTRHKTGSETEGRILNDSHMYVTRYNNYYVIKIIIKNFNWQHRMSK